MLCSLLLLLLAASAYFACTETAFSSVNKIRVKTRADNGDRRAKKAVYILNNFDSALSTILCGTNVCHIAIASIATLIATDLFRENAAAYSTIITTVVVFFVGETIPKYFAKARCDDVSVSCAPSLRFLMTVLKPFVFLFSSLAKLVSRLFGVSDNPTVTEEELYGIIDTISVEGSIEDEKGKLLQSAMDFDDRTAQDVFTARVDLEALDIDTPAREIVAKIQASHHSRIPVFEDTIDNIVGILSIRKYLKEYLRSGDRTQLRPLLDKPNFVHKSMCIDDLLRDMSSKKIQLSVVTDDYGGTLGIVTVEDILEELVGEIWDEDDEVKTEITKLSDTEYEIDGSVLLTDVFEMIGFSDYDEDELAHTTLAGWTLEQMQEELSEGEGFEYKNLRITIKKMDNRRVTLLGLCVLPAESEEEA